jgi:hypothetical protein
MILNNTEFVIALSLIPAIVGISTYYIYLPDNNPVKVGIVSTITVGILDLILIMAYESEWFLHRFLLAITMIIATSFLPLIVHFCSGRKQN